MRLGVIVVLFLCLCPMGVGMGRESGGLNIGAQASAPAQAANGSAAPTGQAQKGEQKPLTNDDVVGMLKAGLAENTIVLAIQHSSTAFDTSPQALIALHNQAVPPTVIDAMLKAGSEKSTSPAGSGASPASTPARPRPSPPICTRSEKSIWKPIGRTMTTSTPARRYPCKSILACKSSRRKALPMPFSPGRSRHSRGVPWSCAARTARCSGTEWGASPHL